MQIAPGIIINVVAFVWKDVLQVAGKAFRYVSTILEQYTLIR